MIAEAALAILAILVFIVALPAVLLFLSYVPVGLLLGVFWFVIVIGVLV